jgi:hypothetical protein
MINKLFRFIEIHPKSNSLIGLYLILSTFVIFQNKPLPKECGTGLFVIPSFFFLVSFIFACIFSYRMIDRPKLKKNYFILMLIAFIPPIFSLFIFM